MRAKPSTTQERPAALTGQTDTVTQPDYVPIAGADRVRPVERLPVPLAWKADRPADEANPVPARGRRFGWVGPDSGYGLKLAARFAERLQRADGESRDDATAGCFAVGSRRAALFGRAPVIYDMELAFTLWGYLGGAPADLVAFRVPLFRGASHHYEIQREIADRVHEATLRMSPAEVRAKLDDWRNLIDTAAVAGSAPARSAPARSAPRNDAP